MSVLLYLLLIYLIFRFLRNITVFATRSRNVQKDTFEEPAPTPRPTKLIEKEEGEYVDFEEVKD
ncbi:MAG: DUF4834 family protein [Bacteroidales bacterium]|jgi:hypothetical protein